MSINRLITRLAVVSALNNFMRAPYPTLAGDKIFDSKIVPIEDMKEDVAFPMCVVYSDYDANHWVKTQRKKPRLMTLTLELLVIQLKKADPSSGFDYELGYPETDSEIEMSLDLFETQIGRAMSANNSAASCFNHLCPAIDNCVSRRGASVEGGQRLAARQITLECATANDFGSGTIPNTIEAFLAELEAVEDYADRVPIIRDAMTAPASLSAADRMMQNIGWSREVAEKSGYGFGSIAVPPISFNLYDAHGTPL